MRNSIYCTPDLTIKTVKSALSKQIVFWLQKLFLQHQCVFCFYCSSDPTSPHLSVFPSPSYLLGKIVVSTTCDRSRPALMASSDLFLPLHCKTLTCFSPHPLSKPLVHLFACCHVSRCLPHFSIPSTLMPVTSKAFLLIKPSLWVHSEPCVSANSMFFCIWQKNSFCHMH